MSYSIALHNLLDLLCPADQRRTHLDGVDVVRMGDLARRHGTTRWKQAPAGTGRNVNVVDLSLSANGIRLYAHDSNAADHGDGNLMSKSILAQIHADDLVVTLDLAYDTARAVAAGSFPLTFEPVPDELLVRFRGDRLRAANSNDVDRICRQVIGPRVFTEAS